MNFPPDPQRKDARPRTPAPRIDPIFSWPTPREEDFLFYVERNGDLPVNKDWTYGTPYFDPVSYPDHVLVYVTPQTDASWSRWYYASKRILEDKYNWSFTDADIGGTKFKAVAREYVTLRSDFDPATPAMGAAMADLPRNKFSGAYVLAERSQIRTPDVELNSLFVFERRTYVQKVTLTDNGYDGRMEGNLQNSSTLYYRGEIVTGASTIEALVADEVNAYWGLQANKTSRSSQQLSDNWFLVVETRETLRRQTDGGIDVGWPSKQEKSIGSQSLIPAKFREQVITKETTEKLDLDATAVDELPTPATPTGDETQRRHVKVSDYHYDQIVTEENIAVGSPLLGEQTGTWGVEGTSEQLVDEGDPTPFGYGTKSSEVVPLGNGKAVESVVTYPEDVGDDGIIETLTGLQYDEISKATFVVQKSLVDASRALALAAAAQTDTNAAEIQPLDKWHSIMFVSSISSIPDDEVWFETGNISLPNKLDEVGVVWDSSSRAQDDAGGLDNIALITALDAQWTVTAAVSASAKVFAAPYVKIISGYRGIAKVRVTRTFSQTPPTDEVFDIYKFEPVHGTLTILGGIASGGNNTYKRGVGGINYQSGGGSEAFEDNKMAIHDFGPVEWTTGLALSELGDDKDVTVTALATGGSTPSFGFYPTAEIELSLSGRAQLHIPPSSTPLVSGDEYLLHVETKPWRFGWWVRETYTAIVP